MGQRLALLGLIAACLLAGEVLACKEMPVAQVKKALEASIARDKADLAKASAKRAALAAQLAGKAPLETSREAVTEEEHRQRRIIDRLQKIIDRDEASLKALPTGTSSTGRTARGAEGKAAIAAAC
jgi:hypothetical protein